MDEGEKGEYHPLIIEILSRQPAIRQEPDYALLLFGVAAAKIAVIRVSHFQSFLSD
jgi:hypothetical protein